MFDPPFNNEKASYTIRRIYCIWVYLGRIGTYLYGMYLCNLSNYNIHESVYNVKYKVQTI